MDTDPRDRSRIELRPHAVAKALAVVISGLVCAHFVVLVLMHGLGYSHARGFIPMFHLGRELNVPSLFSTALLGLGSVGFYLLHRFDDSVRAGDRHWLVLAGVFAFLALDEWASLHELWVGPVRRLWDTSGIFYYAWVIPYGLGVIMLGIYILPRLLRVPREVRPLFFAAAGMYLSGAMGMEFVEGTWPAPDPGWWRWPWPSKKRSKWPA